MSELGYGLYESLITEALAGRLERLGEDRVPLLDELRAAEAANVFRIAAGALGISWQEVVLFRRLPFHQLNLSDHFGGRISASYDALQQTVTKWTALGMDPAVIQRKLQLVIKQEAGILAMNDAFLLSSFLCAGLALLVWFAQSSRVPALQPVEAVQELQAEELMEQP